MLQIWSLLRSADKIKKKSWMRCMAVVGNRNEWKRVSEASSRIAVNDDVDYQF